MSSYHTSFAQINLQLASSISQANLTNPANQAEGQAQAQPGELTEQQREQISTLVQRAIEQARISTQLRPSFFASWQNLGGIYRNLINVVEGAEDFALQNLGQAVQLHPTDPTLRVEFGGLYYQLALLIQAQQQNQQAQQQGMTQGAQTQQLDPDLVNNLLDQAIQQFRTAVNLRPSYANGYYNLAKAYEAKENYRLAYQAMQLVLSNLEPDSADYQLAQEELLALEKLLPQTQEEAAAQAQQPTDEQAPSNLQEPSPLSSPLPGGPLELPAETNQNTNPLRDLNQPAPAEETPAEEPVPSEETPNEETEPEVENAGTE